MKEPAAYFPIGAAGSLFLYKFGRYEYEADEIVKEYLYALKFCIRSIRS